MLANKLARRVQQGCVLAVAAMLAAVSITGWLPGAFAATVPVATVSAATVPAARVAASVSTVAKIHTASTALRSTALRSTALTSTPVKQAPVKQSLKRVSYRGYTFRVPRSWPVISVAGNPNHCVRFDEHAVYLGSPGANQACPSWLVGTTESLLVQPGPPGGVISSVEDPTARLISVTDHGISVTATFDANPAVIYRVLASASLPAPVITMPDPSGLAAAPAPGASAAAGARGSARHRGGAATRSASARAGSTASTASTADAAARQRQAAGRPRWASIPALPAQVAFYHGLGFDSCAAPSSSYMQAWRRSSPYGAVGIYIGGADRACAQPNLTAAWVRQEAAAGWHFIPLYVGPQAEFGELSSPAQQGAQAASDAVTQAHQLGFGPGTPLYYDMEAYSPAQTSPALSFLSAWTTSLHALGYRSGVYSSSSSGIADLARQYNGHAYAMPDVSFDALWNGATNTADPVYQPSDWPGHQRLHQYSGNVLQNYGGATMDVDQDYLDVNLPAPGGTIQAAPAVTQQQGVVQLFYRGADHGLWRDKYSPRSGWSAPVRMGGTLSSAPTAVTPDASAVDVFYRGADRYLWQVAYQPGRGWRAPRQLRAMGVLGGGPQAVAQANGVIDVFWRGSADRHLWHAQFSPGSGWSGPQGLGGQLASAPSPAGSSPGTVAVFWQGADTKLWQVTRHPGGRWSEPASLGMGPLGSGPQATAQADGQVEVFWRGTYAHHVWAAFRSARGRWTGPHNLGGNAADTPSPASAGGAVQVFWRGPQATLWQVRRSAGGWGKPATVPLGPLGGAPFAAAGAAGSPVTIFWPDGSGVLWSSTLSRAGTWSAQRRPGGVTG